MKRQLFLPIAAVALLATSCGDDNKNDWDGNTMNIQTSSAAVILPSNPSDEPVFVSDYILRYSQSLNDGKVTVKSPNPIKLSDGSDFTFQSPATSASGNQLTTIVEPLPFTTADGTTVRLRTRLTTQYYTYNKSNGQTSPVGPVSVSAAVINISSGYVLKTFQTDCCFSGVTNTLINGDTPYANADILYQVETDLTNRKATVTIYNAKFAEAAPSIRVLRLRNLTLRPDRSSGYVIEGTDIVPEVQEGSEWVPNTRFTFNSFSIVPTNDNLTIASINYRVAQIYTGSCNGTYIVQ